MDSARLHTHYCLFTLHILPQQQHCSQIPSRFLISLFKRSKTKRPTTYLHEIFMAFSGFDISENILSMTRVQASKLWLTSKIKSDQWEEWNSACRHCFGCSGQNSSANKAALLLDNSKRPKQKLSFNNIKTQSLFLFGFFSLWIKRYCSVILKTHESLLEAKQALHRYSVSQ